jgi:hypothetical protein
MALVAKGTGATLAQVPDGASAGGNKRGTYATDLQKTRSTAAQVASGNYSTIAGGQRNTASGAYSAIGGGYLNTASGSGATVAGGEVNTASGSVYPTIAGGTGNTASSNYSFVGGGQSNEAKTNTHATCAGGSSNDATGQYSFVGGGLAQYCKWPCVFFCQRRQVTLHPLVMPLFQVVSANMLLPIPLSCGGG